MDTNNQPEITVEQQIIDRLGIRAGMAVGDFGTGASARLALAAAGVVGGDGQVLMFDVRKSALTAALKLAQIANRTNCRAVWSNLEIFRGAQGVADASLDAGMMVNVLNESKHPKDILAEIHRMLKPGAPLLIIDWAVDANTKLAPRADHRMAPEYISSIATDVGFAPTATFTPSAQSWAIVLTKT